MDMHPAPRNHWKLWLLPLALVAVSTALRLGPLRVLGVRLAWLTYYPTVIVAALFGGLWVGLSATILACLSVLVVLPWLTGWVFISDSVEWLGMAIFFANCGMIAAISSGMRRARAREKQAEVERERFFTLSLDMLCISSSDGHFKRLSPAFTRTLGWSMDELLTKSYLAFVHPDDVAATQAEIKKQMETGEEVLQFENRYLHKDGSWRWLSWKSVPQPGGLMYATARDVTDLRQALADLTRSEESLAVTLNSIGDAVLATDTAGRVTRVNPVAEKLTGWAQGEASGRPVDQVFRIINEETRQPAVIPVDRVLATGEIHGLANHTILIAADGSEHPIADSAAPIRGAGGQMLGVVLVFRDVTEERKADQFIRMSESALRRLNEELERRVEERTAQVRQAMATLDAIEDGAFIFDPESLRFSYVNEGAVRQLGYSRAELLTMTANQLLPDSSEADFRAMLAPALRGERRSRQTTTIHRHQDGRNIPVEVNLQYIAPGGEQPRFISIARDITERRRNESLTFRSQRLESLGLLAGGVAHDLNNALAPILMGVSLLKEKYPDDARVVDLFETCGKRGAAMVRQLVVFAKGAEGERVSTHLGQLIKEFKNILDSTFPKNIRVEIKCDKDLPGVLGDETQIHQVLLNLCVNARDAMPDGGTLTVEARLKDIDAVAASSLPEARSGRYVALYVRDTGTGIPPDTLDRIFDPFFTTKPPDQGTGLGLSTAMGIVRGHRGFLHAYSQLGEGSTFAAYFPAEESWVDPSSDVAAGTGFRGKGEMILFVDDEAVQREMARLVLRRLNFEPVTATDGADGLIQAAENRHLLGAVITDLHMPLMDGLAFARAIRRMLPDVPILAATGRLEGREQEELAALDVTAILSKPFTEEQMAAALRRAFQA